MKTQTLGLLIAAFVFVSTVAPPAAGQCGFYFKPNYRAVNKIGPGNFFGSPYTLNDWTGDGRLDFWNFRQIDVVGPVQIIIYPALAAGYWNWNSPIVYITGLPSGVHTQTASPVVRDFDGDGRMDLMVTATNTQGVRSRTLHRNVGDGSFQAMASTTEPGGGNAFMRHIGWFDINSDGKLDWVYAMDEVITANPDSLNYSLQNGDGSFGPSTTIITSTVDNEFNNSVRAAGDYDGDGKVDISYQTITSPERRVRVLKNVGNTTFVASSPITMLGITSGVTTEDYNNDGRADLLTIGSGQFVVYYGQSNATLSPLAFTARNNPASPNLRTADMNGDGRIDVLNLGDQNYEVFLSDPAVGFTMQYYPRRIQPANYQFVLSDFTGDGKADLYDSSHLTTNTFGEEVVVINAASCDPRGSTRAMSFDALPASNDIASWNSATGEWRTFNGDWPQSGILTTRSFAWGTTGDIPSPGDFDGDLKTDHTVYRNSEGNWYVFLSATNSWFVFRFGLPGDIPVPNDYDGGGNTDIAVFRPSDGNWHFWSTETQQYSVVHWGTNGDKPVPADYDGDGKTDIGVFRPSTGDWYYLRSGDQSYGITHWGTTGDVPVPADYDGDLKADLAVFRIGVWYILRSSNDTYSVINWGTTGDLPIPILERGDIAFPVVYRPSNSRWYHRRWQLGDVATPGAGAPVYFGLPNN